MSAYPFCGQSFWLAVQGMFSGYRVPQSRDIGKRAARTVLTGMCYSVGSATRQGSSSPTRFIGQSAMTSRT
ncbi:hypothetical protein BZG30_03175 [Escherichia coli]|nr:hypothetical protein [Escherichia coli]